MKNILRLYKPLLLILAFLFAGSNVFAADDALSGKITIESRSASFVLGVEWGSGVLTLNNGSKHNFSVKGLKAVGIGFQRVSAAGEVYNLKNVAELAGRYSAEEATATLAGGEGAASMKNQHGVVIKLRSTQKGMGLTLAKKGVTIRLKE